MKKYLVWCSVLLTLAGFTLTAQEGYTGPGLELVSVEGAKKLKDDSPVILRGKIERFLGDEKYLFADESGNITIEIDDRLWKGLSVNQNDVVEITGEIDKDFITVEIEVRSIKKI
jgi:uncharacterized protein (TIGR00156 family)